MDATIWWLRSSAASPRALPEALGISHPDARYGTHAEIFFDRIERVSVPADVDAATTLGDAIAHEVGHVLLGSAEHATAGIMKARWGRAEYQEAAQGYIKFTPLECAQIHNGVVRRLKQRVSD